LDNNQNIKVIIALITLCIITISCKKEKSRICELYSNQVGYAVGTIQSFTSTPFKATYRYDYTINGSTFSGREKVYGVGQKDDKLIGKKFVVIYAIADNSNSDLNTDFQILTTQDFDDFNTEFSSAPPSPNFPNKCK
jgi:hypothetical protein